MTGFDKLQDKLSKGLGVAARKLGAPTIVYRPVDCSQPLAEVHRVAKISAAFEPEDRLVNSKGVVSPIWRGIFDTYYTRPADYLVSSSNIYFISSQTFGQMVVCILTNRVISVSRPTFTPPGGYSGSTRAECDNILVNWPANVTELVGSASGQQVGRQNFGTRVVLLPTLPTALRVADVITDDLGSTYNVEAAEQNALGWRLLVRQIGA